MVEHIVSNKYHLLKEQRIGMTKMMHNKLEATIIKYNTSTDIDVQFEDGVIVENKTYQEFKHGSIRHPYIHTTNKVGIEMQKQRMHQSQQMNNGMVAEIIQYKNAHDVSIQFEDGTVAEHVSYRTFMSGGISHPNIQSTLINSLQEFAIRYYLSQLGFRKIEQGEWKSQGFGKQELDFYHDQKHIAIEYDGGLHRQADAIERDRRKDEKCKKLGIVLYRLRDPSLPILQDGSSINYILDKAKTIRSGIIDCKKELIEILEKHDIAHDNIDIDFCRDSDAIVSEYNSTYVNYYSNKRIGEKHYSNNAKQNVTIVAYRSAGDIDVQFEDGTVRTGVAYSHVVNGVLLHPKATTNEVAKQRIGITRIMNNGLQATIIAYRKSEDIDVQFEDGSVRYNVTYDHFKNGKIGHPSTLRGHGADTRLGEEKIMNCGVQAKVIAYRQAHDIDVQFSTGDIRHHVDYYSFKIGRLLPVNRCKLKGDNDD